MIRDDRKRACGGRGVLARGLLIVYLAATAVGCAGKAPVREVTPRDLLTRAEARIDDGDYIEAIETLTQLTLDHPGVAFIDRVVFQLGRAHLEAGEYEQSAAQFRRLARDYPFSEYADDAAFLIAEGYYRQRGKPATDPTNAQHADAALERFLREHPESPLAPEAREKRAVLRDFFAKKKYENGRQYQRLGHPASAVIYFENVFSQYPDAEVTPLALLELARSQWKLGEREEACTALALLDELPSTPGLDAARLEARNLAAEWRCAQDTTADGTVGAAR